MTLYNGQWRIKNEKWIIKNWELVCCILRSFCMFAEDWWKWIISFTVYSLLLRGMDQDTRWLTRYDEVRAFIEANHRNPSKYVGEERELRNWIKQQRTLVNAGTLKEDRVEKFKKLLEMMEQYKRKNQYEWKVSRVKSRESRV